MEKEDEFEQRQEIFDTALNELRDKCAKLCSHSSDSEEEEEDEEDLDKVQVRESPFLYKAWSVDMFAPQSINKQASSSVGIRKIS